MIYLIAAYIILVIQLVCLFFQIRTGSNWWLIGSIGSAPLVLILSILAFRRWR